MGGLAYLEVLDSRHRVRERVRVDSFPATIGRSYENDVILDDNFVCPRHAQVVRMEDGSFVVEDLGSVNGLFRPKGRNRLTRLSLVPGDAFRVGRTTVRFCTPDQQIADTSVDGGSGMLRVVDRPLTAAAVMLAGIAVLGNAVFLSSYDDVNGMDFLVGLIIVGMALAFWAGFWAVGTRIVSSRFRFLQHIGWASALCALAYLADTVFGYISFALSSDAIGWVVVTPLFLILAWLFLYGHLSLASTLTKKTKHIIVGVIMGGIATLGMLGAYAESTTFSSHLVYDGTLKPISVRLVRARSADSFFADLEDLKRNADEEVEADR